MALRKTTSRSIMVDGETYRWTVSDNVDVLDVTVQAALGAGQKLVLHFSPQVKEQSPHPKITPSVVARGVQLALAAGWIPGEAGPPMHGRLNDNRLETWRA